MEERNKKVTLTRYEWHKQGEMPTWDDESLRDVAKDLINVLREHSVTYEEAKAALDLTDQILLNKLLSNTNIKYLLENH